MFDGVLGVGENDCKSGTGSAQTWLYWRPDPAITGVTSLTIWASNTQTVRINGGAPTGQTNGSPATGIDIANPPETITEIAIQGNTISSATVGGIVINGETLVDNGILTNAVEKFGTGIRWIKDRVNDGTQHNIVFPSGGVFTCPSTGYGGYTPPSGESVAWCFNTGYPQLLGIDSMLAVSTYEANQLFDHNLGAPADFIIAFSGQLNQYHPVYHKDATGYLRLESNAAETGLKEDLFPTNTSTQIGVSTVAIALAGNYVGVLAVRSVPGFSQVGRWTGAGGPGHTGSFVSTDFKPAFVMFKRADGAFNWEIRDTTRSPHNPNSLTLYTNQNWKEAGPDPLQDIDLLSNGFKLKNAQNNSNQGDMLYVAFAENPFQSPVTAR